jgi:AraC family transcriptional regulator
LKSSTTSTNGKQMKAPVDMLILPEPPMCEATSADLSIVAAQLVEAACSACAGDREAARAHIAHAVAILQGRPSFAASVMRAQFMGPRPVARGGLTAWQVRRLIAHVDANFARRIRVVELAELLGLTIGHFARTFKRAFGVSPHAYVLRRRIGVAQGLMLTTSEPLSSIALTCGMCDQSHLTHAFHRIVGETPDSWRRTRRGALRDPQLRRLGKATVVLEASANLFDSSLGSRRSGDTGLVADARVGTAAHPRAGVIGRSGEQPAGV